MQWEQLLNTKRRTHVGGREGTHTQGDQRTEYERDYDRVIFTSSFRRLQDKAQVFPLEASDFVRTRLTHTIEVSTLGRSLAVDVGRRLRKGGLAGPEMDPQDIATIVATTSLVHDIGNPPFGHFGETAIQEWFEAWLADPANDRYSKDLSTQQKNDFLHFEGNAQALRILVKLQMLHHDKGVNLTYATLGSAIKYPCSSIDFDKDSTSKAKTKPGYFESEQGVFREITEAVGTEENRHPLVYLMEAADDIAYSAIDIEDAVKKGCLRFDDVLEELQDSLKSDDQKMFINELLKFRSSLPSNWPEKGNVAMQQFRIRVHGVMVRACSDAFVKHYQSIMEGTFEPALIEASDAKEFYDALNTIARKRVYNVPDVLTLEYLGREVIHGLLDRFVPAVLSSNREKTKTAAGKLYHLISPTFRFAEKEFPSTECKVYNDLQLVTDFICGMTDTYALSLYQRLTGVKIY